MNLRKLFSCAATLCALVAIVVAQGAARGKAEATVNGKAITIDYGRPSLKGRDILSLAPQGMVWRLGMNMSTSIETAGDLVVAGQELKAGKYPCGPKRLALIAGLSPSTQRPAYGRPRLKDGFIAELL